MTPTPLLDLILQHGGPFGLGLAVGMMMWLLKHQEGLAKDRIIIEKDGAIAALHKAKDEATEDLYSKFLELHKNTLDAMNASTRVGESVNNAVTAIYAIISSPIGRKR